jgi:hypothetical protein
VTFSIRKAAFSNGEMNRRPRRALSAFTEELRMSDASHIKAHMEVFGADGVHVGTVDKVEKHRIKLTKKDSGQGHQPLHHHFIDIGLVADVEGNKVRLSANADVAVTLEEHQ